MIGASFMRRLLGAITISALLTSVALPARAAEPQVIGATFPINSDGDLVILPVRVWGKVYEFALDTGVGPTVYDVSLKNALGAVKHEVEVDNYGRPVHVQLFTPPEAVLGTTKLRSTALVAVMDLRFLREFTGSDIRGLVGVDALMNQVVELDFDAGQIRLLDHVGKGAGLPMQMSFGEQGQLYVDADIARWGREEFQVDTGLLCSGRLSRTVFDASAKNGSLSRIAPNTFLTAAGTRRVRRGTLDAIRIGDDTHRALEFCELGSHSDLGIGFLSRYVVTFDFPELKLYLRRGRRFGTSDQRDLSGLGLRRVDGKTIVEGVAPESPASNAGMRKNDVIVRVGMVDAAVARLHVLRGALAVPEKDVHLRLRRDADTFDVRLRLRDWRVYDNPGK